MALNKGPYRLKPVTHEKVWGSTHLEPWFPNSTAKVGEVWFWEQGLPVLIKFLFTTENLSVQVHPNDDQAREWEGGSAGKTEMWHILRAEPGAKLAMGLTRSVTQEELRAASLDGSVMELLRWVPAVPGETWFIPAGTIHAIGGGITLAEIQQYSDVTYRLYDYGRPRELHLERGVAVSDVSSRPQQAGNQLSCQYFHSQVIYLNGQEPFQDCTLIVMDGEGKMNMMPTRAGDVWRIIEPVMLDGRCDILVVHDADNCESSG